MSTESKNASCPKCGLSDRVKKSIEKGRTQRLRCNRCRRSFSDKAGTILHGTKIPIKKWSVLLSLMSEGDMTSSDAALRIGVSRSSAWRMMRKIKNSVSKDLLASKMVELREIINSGDIENER